MKRVLKTAHRNLADDDATSSRVVQWQDFEFKRSEMTHLVTIHYVLDYSSWHSYF